MQDMYRKIMDSDVIIFACPIFCWSYPAQMKPFLDRTYCLDKFASDGTYVSLVEGKKCGLLATAGGDEFDGADLVVEAHQRLASFHRMKDIGHLVVANFHGPEVLEEPYIKERIESFCQKVK